MNESKFRPALPKDQPNGFHGFFVHIRQGQLALK